jgi:hypothetical protein
VLPVAQLAIEQQNRCLENFLVLYFVNRWHGVLLSPGLVY